MEVSEQSLARLLWGEFDPWKHYPEPDKVFGEDALVWFTQITNVSTISLCLTLSCFVLVNIFFLIAFQSTHWEECYITADCFNSL